MSLLLIFHWPRQVKWPRMTMEQESRCVHREMLKAQCNLWGCIMLSLGRGAVVESTSFRIHSAILLLSACFGPSPMLILISSLVWYSCCLFLLAVDIWIHFKLIFYLSIWLYFCCMTTGRVPYVWRISHLYTELFISDYCVNYRQC